MINVTSEMEHLHKLAKCEPSKRFNHLWKNITSIEWLAHAWEQIRSNKGSQTAGIDGITAIDVDLNLINRLAEELKGGKYRPKPVRRVYIPKANGKTRPLGISTIKDRIIQQALKMLFEPIFEADFHSCSHGFRQSQSTHTALRDVAHGYSGTSWIIEGDIESCYDSIPHGKLINQVSRRIADEKVLHLIKLFLKAGYLEEWKYHKTYSGVPQGNIVGPLLSNIFLHQLDSFMMEDLSANRNQSSKEASARRNPEYKKLSSKIDSLRKVLKTGKGNRETIKRIKELERQRKSVPSYAKGKFPSCKIKYVRYADDTLILVAGNKQEAEAIRNQVKEKLLEMGLKLSNEKTKITHWSKRVQFLGYQIQGRLREKGVGIKAVLSVPHIKIRKIQEAINKVSSYYHIQEADVMVQLNVMYRGWCNYYRYCNAPQKIFNKLSRYIWWQYAHFLARKQKSSIAAMIKREKKANRLGVVQKNSRKRSTFKINVGKKLLILDTFPPKTQQIKALANKQDWKVDLKAAMPVNWQSGRSLTTRLAALDRANGRCERCKENPVMHIHHRVPVRGRSFLARVMADRDQQYTATALCEECHLAIHSGSFNPRRRKSSGNAGYIERCLSSVGSAE